MRRRPTLPGVTPVPSALQGLTSLFGMGRGGSPAPGRLCLYGALWALRLISLFLYDSVSRKMQCFKGVQVFGLLVLLSFAISGFTPAAYQRHRL